MTVSSVRRWSALIGALAGGIAIAAGASQASAAPVAAIQTGPSEGSAVSSSSATFTFTTPNPADVGAPLQCTIDGAAQACGTSSATPQSLTFSGLAEGFHLFTVTAIQTAGCQGGGQCPGPTASRSWRVDTLPPETSITAGPARLANTSVAAFGFVSNEFGASFECRLDGAPVPGCTSPLTLLGIVDGSHTLTVRATDAALNIDATPAAFTWTVDTAAPVPPTFLSGPRLPTRSRSAAFAVSIPENGVGFQCSLDRGPFGVCAPPFGFVKLRNGLHVLRIRAIDQAGNVSAVAQRSWFVDTAPPARPLVVVPRSVKRLRGFTVAWRSVDTGSAIARFDVFLRKRNAVGLRPLTPRVLARSTPKRAFPFRAARPGVYCFTVRAFDRAGNASPLSTEACTTVT
jgi:large repetitive protein